MKLFCLTAMAAIGCIMTTAPAFAGATFGDGNGNGASVEAGVSGGATAVAGYGGRPPVTFGESHMQSTQVLPALPLTATASGSATDTAGALIASASATANTTVTFNSAAAGQVEFTGTNSAASNSASGEAFAQSYSVFSYYLVSTTDQPIVIDYNLSSSTLGCCANQISLQDLTGNSSVINKTIYNSDNQGELTGNISAGDVYELAISKAEYLGYDAPDVSGAGASTIPYDDRFSFTIGAVSAAPEPATWALTIVGVGMIGAGFRFARRRVEGPAFA